MTLADATTVARDDFRRSVTGGWGTAPVGGSWSVSQGASFAVGADRGTITNETAGADRTAWLAATNVRDVEATAVFRTDTKALTGNGQTIKILTRRQANYHEYRASVFLRGDGTLNLGLHRIAPGVADTGITGAVPGGFVRGRDYAVRTLVTGANPTTLRAKVWDAATSEPAGWTATWTDSTASLQVAGDVGIASYISGSASGTPVTSAIDAFYAASAGQAPSDITAPSAPGTPSATVSGTTVAVAWGAATDNVGVDQYRVYRGTTADFAVSTGILRGTVAGTATTWQDTGVAVGTWYYRVVAVDAAGNAGAASGSATAVVGSGPPPDTTAPSAPGTPSATVSGTTVALTWGAATDNVGVAQYRIYRVPRLASPFRAVPCAGRSSAPRRPIRTRRFRPAPGTTASWPLTRRTMPAQRPARRSQLCNRPQGRLCRSSPPPTPG